MNVGLAKANLKIIRGRLRQKWAKLTHDDSGYAKGKVDELYGRIEKRSLDLGRGPRGPNVRHGQCRGGDVTRNLE
jgi:uncharacterized protein YjbJ (UPF0337 family)